MNSWLLYTLAAMFLWGFWGFSSKMATNFIRDVDAVIYHSIGTVLVVMIVALIVRFQFTSNSNGIFYAVLSGVFSTLAIFFFFVAIARGRSVIVVSMTALYPLVTLTLSVIFLHETITPKQLLGVGLALGAIVLLSS